MGTYLTCAAAAAATQVPRRAAAANRSTCNSIHMHVWYCVYSILFLLFVKGEKEARGGGRAAGC